MQKLQPQADNQPRAARLHAILTEHFRPARLEIRDDSSKHAGHSGASAGGETHFSIALVSDEFTSRTRLERSRMVHSALASEFASGLHALSLSLHSPVESKS